MSSCDDWFDAGRVHREAIQVVAKAHGRRARRVKINLFASGVRLGLFPEVR
jgi:hypothetical protein